MELKPNQMTVIIYGAIRELCQVTYPDTPWPAFDKLDQADREALEDQTLHIIENPRVKPAELHERLCVTSQKLIADGGQDPNSIARLNIYMIPFRELATSKKTEIRLHLQMARTLLRHNRNVKRDEKRQRSWPRLSG